MNKKEISELKKQFTPDNCTISRICGCYVDAEKEKRLEMLKEINSIWKQIDDLLFSGQ